MDLTALRSFRLSRQRVWLCLTLILLFGAGLRVWYSLADPGPRRFWDERYNFENARKILETWSFEPAKGYYPSPIQTWPQALTLAASQRLSAALGIEALETVDELGRFTPTAYIQVRLISVLYGTATLLILFLVGRRMVSPVVGLCAAFALAATPWHIHSSGLFKPDALLVLTVVLAFYWSLAAIERGRVRDYALAGFGICLAMSAKIMGGLVALPLALGTLMIGWREWRRIALLALAAGTSLATFLILNPYAERYRWYVAHLQEDYAMRAARRGMSRDTMLAELADYFFGPYVHGPVLGSLALVGMVWLAIGALRSRTLSPVECSQRIMLVVFPPLYAAAYASATPYFKGNNLLPVVPFTLMAGMWLVLAAAAWGTKRVPVLGSRPLGGVAAALLIVALGTPGPVYVYRSLTPSTRDVALRFLGRGVDPDSGRIVFSEEIPIPEPPGQGFHNERLALQVVERLDRVPIHRLSLSDGELFPESRLAEPAADFYRQRMERVHPRRVATFRPRPFELRGPALVAIRHRRRPLADWPRVNMACSSADETCFAAALPPQVGAGELVSLWVRIPAEIIPGTGTMLSLRVGERQIPLVAARRRGRMAFYMTERFRLRALGQEVRLGGVEPGERTKIRVVVCRWGRGQPPDPPD